MKWITHILYAALFYRLIMPTDVAFALAAAATAATDLAGHNGLRRNKYHDVLAFAFHTLAAVLYTPSLIAAGVGAAAGLSHVALDLISPGKLAVSWPYNILFIIPALLLWTLLL